MLTLNQVWGNVRSASAQNNFPLAVKNIQDFAKLTTSLEWEPVLFYLSQVFLFPDYDNSGYFHFRGVTPDAQRFWVSEWEIQNPESVYQGPIPSLYDVVLCVDLWMFGSYRTYCLSKPLRYCTVGKDLQWPSQGPYVIQRVAAPAKPKNISQKPSG